MFDNLIDSPWVWYKKADLVSGEIISEGNLLNCSKDKLPVGVTLVQQANSVRLSNPELVSYNS